MLPCTHAAHAQGYGDYFWVDVVEKIDEMGETVNQYQNQSKKLPKALREWQAYLDCRKTIDDFLEMLPLFQVRWVWEGLSGAGCCDACDWPDQHVLLRHRVAC